jgi:hypothetical protein
MDAITVPIFFGIVAIIMVIVGWWFNYKNIKKTGGFDFPELKIYLMEQSVAPNHDLKEIIYGHNAKKGDLVFCQLPFEIRNEGNKSAENLHLKIFFPLGLRCIQGFKDEIFEHKIAYGAVNESDVKRISNIYRGYECVEYYIKELGPKLRTILPEVIDVSLVSGIPLDINAVSKDKIPFRVKLQLILSAKILISLSAKNLKPVEGRIEINGLIVQDKDDLEKKVIAKKLKSIKEELLKKESINIHGKSIVIYPKLQKIPLPIEFSGIKQTAYIEEPEESIRGLFEPIKKHFFL